MDDLDGDQEAYDDQFLSDSFMYEMGDAVAALFQQQSNKSGGRDSGQQQRARFVGAHPAALDAPAPWLPDSSSSNMSAAAGAAPSIPPGLPSLSLLLHDNPSLAAATQAASKQRKHHPHFGEAGLPAAAAIGVGVALTGSLLSFALARARAAGGNDTSKGLAQKDAALSELRGELDGLRAAAGRMLQLEAELTASNDHLAAMNAEVEARASGVLQDRDMASFQDQLRQRAVNASEGEVRTATAAAEARARVAVKERELAEAQVREAEAASEAVRLQLEAARLEVETLRGELGLRGSQLEGLTRELEFTRRQLANAEKRVERAQMEARSKRVGYSSEYDAAAWD